MTLFHDQQIGNAHQLQFRGVYNNTGVKNDKSHMENLFLFFTKLKILFRWFKVVNSREVREVVEGTTCISDKKLSEIC